MCERLAGQICSLPLFPGMSDAELQRVSDAVLGFTQDQSASAVDGADGRFADKLEKVTAGPQAAADGDVIPPPAQGREKDRG